MGDWFASACATPLPEKSVVAIILLKSQRAQTAKNKLTWEYLTPLPR